MQEYIKGIYNNVGIDDYSNNVPIMTFPKQTSNSGYGVNAPRTNFKPTNYYNPAQYFWWRYAKYSNPIATKLNNYLDTLNTNDVIILSEVDENALYKVILPKLGNIQTGTNNPINFYIDIKCNTIPFQQVCGYIIDKFYYEYYFVNLINDEEFTRASYYHEPYNRARLGTLTNILHDHQYKREPNNNFYIKPMNDFYFPDFNALKNLANKLSNLFPNYFIYNMNYNDMLDHIVVTIYIAYIRNDYAINIGIVELVKLSTSFIASIHCGVIKNLATYEAKVINILKNNRIQIRAEDYTFCNFTKLNIIYVLASAVSEICMSHKLLLTLSKKPIDFDYNFQNYEEFEGNLLRARKPQKNGNSYIYLNYTTNVYSGGINSMDVIYNRINVSKINDMYFINVHLSSPEATYYDKLKLIITKISKTDNNSNILLVGDMNNNISLQSPEFMKSLYDLGEILKYRNVNENNMIALGNSNYINKQTQCCKKMFEFKEVRRQTDFSNDQTKQEKQCTNYKNLLIEIILYSNNYKLVNLLDNGLIFSNMCGFFDNSYSSHKPVLFVLTSVDNVTNQICQNIITNRDNKEKQLNQELSETNKKLVVAQENFSKADIAYNKYKTFAEGIKTTLTKSENKLKESENKLQESENKLKESENKLQESENKLQESENKLQESENKNVMTNNDLIKITNEYKKISDNHKSTMDQVALLKDNVAIYLANLEKSNKINKTLTDDAAVHLDNLEKSDKINKTLMNTIEINKQKLAGYENDISQLKKDLDGKKLEMDLIVDAEGNYKEELRKHINIIIKQIEYKNQLIEQLKRLTYRVASSEPNPEYIKNIAEVLQYIRKSNKEIKNLRERIKSNILNKMKNEYNELNDQALFDKLNNYLNTFETLSDEISNLVKASNAYIIVEPGKTRKIYARKAEQVNLEQEPLIVKKTKI